MVYDTIDITHAIGITSLTRLYYTPAKEDDGVTKELQKTGPSNSIRGSPYRDMYAVDI
jgi:hypothetical protein